MAGRANEQRERTIVEVFAELHPQGLCVVEHRDKPDAVVETSTGQQVGVEVTELLADNDGRDRSLEGVARAGIVALCRELLGPSGDVDVRMHSRPRDRAQVERWLAAFRVWLLENRSNIRQRGTVGLGLFPHGLDVAFAQAQVALFGEGHLEEMERTMDLDWLHVQSISVAHDASGWQVYGLVGTEHLANRHEHDHDKIVLQAVAEKIRKANGYVFDGQLWLLLRSFVHERASDEVSARIVSLPGIECFAEVWLLDVPANTLDAARPPLVCRLYR